MSKGQNMGRDVAIQVEHLSKVFTIPHEKISTLGGHVVNAFRKKTYETFHALKDVSFTIKKGEFVGIIGKNGSGKSTLLKILAGIYQPDHGSIHIQGEISPFLELGIGFNPELSGRDNIYLNGAILGMKKLEIDLLFDEIVAFAELERFIDQKLKNYSSGMQVRLAFSVSVHAKKDILLMDEVLAVGDANFQAKCFDKFFECIESGRTVILVTHDIVTVRQYCDRVLYLRDGMVHYDGVPEQAVHIYSEDNVQDQQSQTQDTGTPSTPMEMDTRKRIASVLDAWIEELDQEKKHAIKTGDKIKIVTTYILFESLENPVLGIMIKDIHQHAVFVSNTLYMGIETGHCSKGVLKVTYSLPCYFATGTYTITSAICDKTTRVYYDWQDLVATFTVTNALYHSGGSVDVPHTISIEQSAS